MLLHELGDLLGCPGPTDLPRPPTHLGHAVAVGQKGVDLTRQPDGGAVAIWQAHGRPGLGQRAGVGRLVIARRARERHEDGRQTHHGELRHRGGPSSTHH